MLDKGCSLAFLVQVSFHMGHVWGVSVIEAVGAIAGIDTGLGHDEAGLALSLSDSTVVRGRLLGRQDTGKASSQAVGHASLRAFTMKQLVG